MTDTIAVYFKNHKIAKFSKEKAVFGTPDSTDIVKQANEGKAVINWENVCFVQECEPPRRDDMPNGD